MAINLTMQEKLYYLHVKCNGEFKPNAFLDACKEALSFASGKKIVAILIDLRNLTVEPLTTMERFKIGEEFANLQRSFPFDSRVAVLGNEPLIEPNRFGELVAINRGAAGKVFTDMNEATKWLERGKQEGLER